MSVDVELEDLPTPAARCAVEVSPSPVQAGAQMTLRGIIEYADPESLEGRDLLILDAEGDVIAELPVVAIEQGFARTADIILKAPAKAGTYGWTAMLPGGKEGESALLSDMFTFTVDPHRTRLVVWDVPSALPVDETFTVKIGAKCSGGCDMAGTELEILDQDGVPVQSFALSEDIWDGSEGLHYREITLRAPADEGLFKWAVRAPDSEQETSHAGQQARLTLRCVAQPECRVVVKAYDTERHQPIAGAKVVMHPFRGRTDADGVAAFTVPKGAYTLFVSASRYESVSRSVEIVEDFEAQTELAPEPPEDLARGYY